MTRFYAEPSERHRVIDRRDGKVVFSAEPGHDAMAGLVCRAMNNVWERDVALVAEWLKDVEDDRGCIGHDGDSVNIADLWREEMGS